MTLKKQLAVLSGGFVLILLIEGAINFYSSQAKAKLFHQVANIELPAVRSMTLADMMHDGLRAVAISAILESAKGNKDAFIELDAEVQEKASDFRRYINELEALELSQEVKDAVSSAKPEMEAYITSTEKIVLLAKTEGPVAAQAGLDPFMASFRVLEDKMGALGELIEASAKATHSDTGSYDLIQSIGFVIGIIFAIVAGFFVTRSATKQIQTFSDFVKSSTDRLLAASQSLQDASQKMASASSETAASLEETAASLEELSATVKLNSDHSGRAEGLAMQSLNFAEKGVQQVNQFNVIMTDLQASSKQMEEIVKVIDDIAFQTNLLALNASVEAARAGEMGRGFAVVAEAVRGLAQRSASSAKDISTLIQQSIEKIQAGGASAQSTSVVMTELFEGNQKVQIINKEIASGSNEQSQGLHQINEAMGTLDQSAQVSSQLANEVSASSQQISQLAGELQTQLDTIQKQMLG